MNMEDTGNAFFYMAVSAVLFVAAVACLMFGVRSVVMGVKIREKDFADEAMYETVSEVAERVVMGDWVLAFALSEPEYDIRVELQGGTSYVLPAGTTVAGSVEALNVPFAASFTVDYEYGAYGGLKAVCFKER